MPETAANHAAEPYSLSTGESGVWEGEDRENARGRRRSSGTPAAARSKDGDGCQIRPRSLGEDDAFSQHASASIPRVDPRDTTLTHRLRHKANKTVTATVAPVNHTVSTRNGDAPLPTRASPGARTRSSCRQTTLALFRSARRSGFFARGEQTRMASLRSWRPQARGLWTGAVQAMSAASEVLSARGCASRQARG